MKISKRLKTIAEMVDNVNKIYDVGCDHAYLDIYLASKGFNCVAIDVRPNIIKTALKNVIDNGLLNKIEVILNDGLNNIMLTENDVVILSGLGTNNILEILKNSFVEKVIIQSNDNLFLLRKIMTSRNYFISEEKIIYEDNKYYVIIKFEKGSQNYSEYELLLGPKLLESINDVFKEYLMDLYQHFVSVLEEIPNCYLEKKLEIEKNINYIKTALN